MPLRSFIAAFLAVLGLGLSLTVTHAQPSLDWAMVDGIGGISGNGQIAIVGTVSSEDAGLLISSGRPSIRSVFDPILYYPPFMAPVLQISLQTNHAIVSWYAGYSSLQLQYASEIAGTNTQWSDVTQAPVFVDFLDQHLAYAEWHVTMPMTSTARFFRWRQE